MKNKTGLIDSCSWLGQYVASHEIGEYFIVEYKPKKYDGCYPVKGQFESESSFKPFINGTDTKRSYESLEAAIVGAIAQKYDGVNTRADEYFMKSINS